MNPPRTFIINRASVRSFEKRKAPAATGAETNGTSFSKGIGNRSRFKTFAALAEHFSAKPRGSQLYGTCPTHGGRSLQITESPGGKVLLRCWNGCETSAVLAAAGLTFADLFLDGTSSELPVKHLEASKESLRANWPAFRPLSDAEQTRLAALRGLSVEAVKLAAARGLLFASSHATGPCWVVTDSTRQSAQIRRLDGLPFLIDGKSVKPQNLRGSVGQWPVGLPFAEGKDLVLVIEGSGDFLAAHEFIRRAGLQDSAAVVAMLGAGMRFSPSVLPRFTGCRVVIVPHRDKDKAGQIAGDAWAAQLQGHAASVRLLDLSPWGVKDLNDLARSTGADILGGLAK